VDEMTPPVCDVPPVATPPVPPIRPPLLSVAPPWAAPPLAAGSSLESLEQPPPASKNKQLTAAGSRAFTSTNERAVPVGMGQNLLRDTHL